MKGRNFKQINQAEQKCMKELIYKICNHEGESDVFTESMADIDSVIFQVSHFFSFLLPYCFPSFLSSIMCSASPVNVLQRSPGTLL